MSEFKRWMKLNKEFPVWSRSLLTILMGLLFLACGYWATLERSDEKTVRMFFVLGSVLLFIGVVGLLYFRIRMWRNPAFREAASLTEKELNQKIKEGMKAIDAQVKELKDLGIDVTKN